jgi:Arc/MetJ-type ribon-helix-helix transcriptional regulator
MKVSVSLPDEDIEFLDTYAATSGMTSRSAVLHKAVRLLKAHELSDDYESAWDEWSGSDDGQQWDNTLADGVDP